MQTAKGEGMQMMDQHILELLKSKHINAEEAYRCARWTRRLSNNTSRDSNVD